MADTKKTENRRVADWLKNQLDGRESIENHLILAGSGSDRVLTSGMVLAKKTVTGTATSTTPAATTGDGVMGAITVSNPAVPGRYKLTVVTLVANKGDFVVENPNGKVIGAGIVASAFSEGGLAFTLADGAADYIVGDVIFIDVVVTAVKFIQLVLAGTDGSEIAAGLLYLDTTALENIDKAAAIVTRDAMINKDMITHPTGASAAQKLVILGQLNELKIRNREGA